MMNLQNIKQNLFNIRGWRTNRRIVVLESDDWGSIRTRSNRDLDTLRKNNIKVDNCHYMLNDSLASESDLSELFHILTSFKDSRGNHPMVTANCLVTNPDFDKIRASNFKEYYFENFRETLNKYPEHTKSFEIWEEGMSAKLFHPQSHGREHLSISRWMRDLGNGNIETRAAFDLDMFGVSGHVLDYQRGSYLAAFDGGLEELKYDRNDIVKEGLSLFLENFGYNSESFIAPNYVWDENIETAMFNSGVKYIQSSRAQRVSNDFGKKREIKRHYLGQKNHLNQYYLVRNCVFEPSENKNKNWVTSCLNEIEISFKWRKPAIISTHRVNYIGFINQKNRDVNLPLLKELLSQILKKWPTVEFMTSNELGKVIATNEE